MCADLEDAIEPDAKSGARASVLELLANGAASPHFVVRINHPSTSDGERDIEAIARLGRLPNALVVMVPKTDSRAEVDGLRERLGPDVGEISIIPIIETAEGLLHVADVAKARGVVAVLFGGVDLAADLGAELTWEALLIRRTATADVAGPCRHPLVCVVMCITSGGAWPTGVWLLLTCVSAG